MQDRTYYRALMTGELLLKAREEGINPEMAVAIADALAVNVKRYGCNDSGKFHFNPKYLKETSK